MKTLAITGTRRLEVIDRPIPAARDDIVKVRLDVVPMCTEFKSYLAGETIAALGHEAAGTVVDAGRSHRVTAGDRVVVMPQYGCGVCALCASGNHIFCPDQRDVLSETGSQFGTATFAEYLIKPDWLLLPVPQDLTLKQASMACCALGPAFNAMKSMRVSGLDVVLVAGCGPVGLGAIIAAAALGARVIALDVSEYRLKLALQLGVCAAIDPTEGGARDKILQYCDRDGVNAVFDSISIPDVVGLIEAVTRPRARIAFVAHKPVQLHRLVGKGLEVRGCWHWNHQRDADEMFGIIRRSVPSLDALVTHEFALEEAEDAFRLQIAGNCGKIILYPHAKDHENA